MVRQPHEHIIRKPRYIVAYDNCVEDYIQGGTLRDVMDSRIMTFTNRLKLR